MQPRFSCGPFSSVLELRNDASKSLEPEVYTITAAFEKQKLKYDCFHDR